MELRRIIPLHLTPLSLPPLSLPPLLLVLSLLTSLTSLVSAQSGQGVLIDGNSRLPTCAQQCTLLQQAAQACTAATGPSTQAGWICFCQSAYLKTLRSTAVGICDAACTDPSDNAQVSVWYNGNCGNDNGASEHAEDGLNSQPSSGGSSNNNNGPTTGSGSTNTNTGDGNSNSNSNGPPQNSSGSDDDVKSDQTWWAGHYQWIIMILVLIIAFALFTWGLIFLKKRLDRKRDAMTGGFNAGITTRKVDTEKGVAPQTSGSTLHPSSASGRNSPARTREAFMPYGYGYSGSESRNGSRNEVIPLEEKKSPLARTTTMATEESRDDTEKSEVDGMGPWPVPGKSERRTPGNGKPGVVM